MNDSPNSLNVLAIWYMIFVQAILCGVCGLIHTYYEQYRQTRSMQWMQDPQFVLQ